MFMDENERIKIIRALSLVDKAFISLDKQTTQITTLIAIHTMFGYEYSLSFANGGDQNNKSIQYHQKHQS